MQYQGLKSFIDFLSENEMLTRITAFVSPELEITEIVDRISKHNGKALLFENNGTRFPILINAFGSHSRMSVALGVEDIVMIPERIEELFSQVQGAGELSLAGKIRILSQLKNIAHWFPSKLNRRGACQKNVIHNPDLSVLPVLTCWPLDGGPYITLPVVHTEDPENGKRNVGMYRMQVLSSNSTGMHWQMHKDGASHYNRYKKLGKKMPVSVSLGGDPVYTYVATAPLPHDIDEYLFAGFLRNRKVKLVKCITNDIYIPEDADIVLEGYVDPMEELVMEGPFGDHTGFYSLADKYPVFHVTCITYRDDAVYPATIVGIPPMEDAWLGYATEKIFTPLIKKTIIPELHQLHMPAEGAFHNLVIAGISVEYKGQGMKVIHGLLGAGQMMFSKIVIVTSNHTNPENYREVVQTVCRNTLSVDDFVLLKGPSDVLDHASSHFAYGGKLGIDATEKTVPDGEPKKHEIDPVIQKDIIKEQYSEIVDINDQLLLQGSDIIIISVKKIRKDHVRQLDAELRDRGFIRSIRFIVYTDPVIDIFDYRMVVWYVTANLDPSGDILINRQDDGFRMLVDGTSKSNAFDAFPREWPDVIVMNQETISKVDNRWNDYGLGGYLQSPSNKINAKTL